MRRVDFKKGYPGRLVKSPPGVWAFVPDPLPPVNLGIDWETANLLSEADRKLSELAGLARNLPNPNLLIDPFIRREAVLSSRIEGTQTTLSDLLLFEVSPNFKEFETDAKEVSNYVKAMDMGLTRLKDLPLSLRLIRELHAQLMEDVRGTDKTPGEFRRSQNFIGVEGARIEEATYVPPPVPEMKEALSDLEKFLHRKSSFPPLIKQALVHYQFEAIHPFLDGNGRVGRLLLTLSLCSDQIIPYPILYLSDYIEKTRKDYYRLLLSVSQDGNWTGWITYFLRGIAIQSSDALSRSSNLLDLWRNYGQTLKLKKATVHQLKLIDLLFESPVITAGQVARSLKVTPTTAISTIQRLLDTGILDEYEKGRKRNRVYFAPEIVRIIESR
jgi:Fic family protein